VYLKKFGFTGRPEFADELAQKTNSFTSADFKGLI
jgi:SpoVK/Ycf46/Vps4 family AAA+-type ATPase